MISALPGPLPTWTELRSIARTLRPRTLERLLGMESHRGGEPNETLVALLADPFESVADAHSRMRAAESYLRSKQDRRSVFLTVYAEMTARVAAGIDAGTFNDPDWVRTYLVAFANRYRSVFVAFERGSESRVPRAWQIGFVASTTDRTILVQDALLGINAHINHDLAHTLVDVGIDPNRHDKRRDHDAINGILSQLVDVVQRSLAEVYDRAGYTELDATLGPLDEALTLIGLTESRSLAWRNAVLLTDTRFDLLKRVITWRVDTVAAGAGYFILSPSLDPSVVTALRRLESGQPPVDKLVDTFRRRCLSEPIGID